MKGVFFYAVSLLIIIVVKFFLLYLLLKKVIKTKYSHNLYTKQRQQKKIKL